MTEGWRACLHCGELFLPTDPEREKRARSVQLYCGKRCAKRDRNRRWQARRRTAELEALAELDLAQPGADQHGTPRHDALRHRLPGSFEQGKRQRYS